MMTRGYIILDDSKGTRLDFDNVVEIIYNKEYVKILSKNILTPILLSSIKYYKFYCRSI